MGRRLFGVYIVAAAITMVIAVLVMLGWFLDSPILVRIVPTFPSMKFNTALAFFILGGAMLQYKRPVRLWLSALVGSIGLLALFQSTIGFDIGMQELFVDDFSMLNGLMSEATSVCFVLMSLGWLIRSERFKNSQLVAQVCFNMVTVVAFLSLVAYVYGMKQSDRLGFMSSMAVHTSILFIFSSIGSLFPYIQVGISRLFVGNSSGNKLAKNMYLIMIFAMIIIGLVVVNLYRNDLISDEGSMTLIGSLTLVICLVGVTYIAYQLLGEEKTRLSLEDQLRQINASLEEKVEKRTRELTQEREFLQQVIDTLPVNVYVKDLESRKILVNSEEMRLMGFTDKSQVIGKNDFDLFPEESAKISRKEDLEVFQNAKAFHSSETNMKLADGRNEWFITSKIPIRDEKGKVSGLIGVSVNITDRKKLEEKLQSYAVLEAKTQEMEQLTYITSHDLKEPLLTIKAYISELFADYGDDLGEDAKYFQRVIEKGVLRMQKLVDGLLEYSRTSARENLQKLNVEELINEICEDLEMVIDETRAKVTVFDLPSILCYPDKLKSLFQNLISNAMKYQDKNDPEVRISCLDKGAYWQFKVSDNGIGIEPRDYKKIFSMFKRLHSKNEYEGTGIGLAQCQKIVEIHNGKIWVESEKARGSHFYFTISKDL